MFNTARRRLKTLEIERLRGGASSQAELCDAVAALEKARGFKEVEGSAIRKTLDKGFKQRGWTWPKSMDEWRRHVERYPPGSI